MLGVKRCASGGRERSWYLQQVCFSLHVDETSTGDVFPDLQHETTRNIEDLVSQLASKAKNYNVAV